MFIVLVNIYILFWGSGLFSRGNFVWEGGGTLPLNSYKPSLVQLEATLHCKGRQFSANSYVYNDYVDTDVSCVTS